MVMMPSSENPIGIFDSGVGGLSVLRQMRVQIPFESVDYVADQAHVPYGKRSQKEVRDFSEEITRFLLRSGAKIIVVACNAASAAALHYLRETFPGIPFVGMEPAVKPAAEITKTGVVGVLATPATFQGALYASVVERFGNGVAILQDTCPGLVEQIEKGELDSSTTRRILESALRPMLKKNADTIVMGCTHYPFVIPLVQQIVGTNVRVIDPSPAVVRQTIRLLETVGVRRSGNAKGDLRFYTSGKTNGLKAQLPILLGGTWDVKKLNWRGNKILQDEASNSPSRP
jgi:glutamate racemase